MATSTRLRRWVTTVIMGSGVTVMMAAALDLIRPMVEGPLANMIPNLPLTPAALVAGGVAIIVGAVARRRLVRPSRLSSPRPGEELKPTAAPRSLAEQVHPERRGSTPAR